MSAPQPTPDDDVVIAPPPLPPVAAADAAAERDRRAAASESITDPVTPDASPAATPPRPPRAAVKRPAAKRPARPRKPKATVPPPPALPADIAAARFEAAAAPSVDVEPASDAAEAGAPASASDVVTADDVMPAEAATASVDALEVAEVEIPEVEVPEVEVPEVEVPEVEVPAVEAAEVEVPEVEVPEVEVPAVEIAEVDIDNDAPTASDELVVPEGNSDEATDAGASDLDALETAIAGETAPADEPDDADANDAVWLRGVTKTFGSTVAVDGIDLRIPAGTFYGIVGPNGAGKTTTLSMIAGLLRADQGEIRVGGVDLASDTRRAKQRMGILPDRLRTFDRLTGRQLLHYYGVLRGLRSSVVQSRSAELARAFDLTDALARPVSDYSAGMTKKIMLAGAMIHSPRVLVLDEPFESVDPVSSAVVLDILSAYVAHGGTVILSSHGMELVERVCTRLAVIVGGRVLAEGTLDEVRGDRTLEQRFIELVGGADEAEGLEWLHTFSD